MSADLYELLPAVYRERDAEVGYPLRALLRVVGEQAERLDEDIRQLWDDFFVETSRPWVIPYIGDLVSNDPLSDPRRLERTDTATELFEDLVGPDLRPPIGAPIRADVANTIFYRRRKGTLAALEQLARDVSGWPAHAVEFFRLLGCAQNVRAGGSSAGWLDIRSAHRDDRVGSPFDEASHTVDVRPVAQDTGWYDIHNVAIFLWRLLAYPLVDVPAAPAGETWRFHFSPLGNPAPLYTRWQQEAAGTGLVRETDVPSPIRRTLLFEDLGTHQAESTTALYGAEKSFSIRLDDQAEPIPASAVVCRRLSLPPDDRWPDNPPSGNVVAVDAESGRIALGSGFADTNAVDVSFHYGFGGDLGGGPYERRAWLTRSDLPAFTLDVREGTAPNVPNAFATLEAALTQAITSFGNTDLDQAPLGLVRLLDSRTYELPAAIEVPNGARLVIEAANGQLPLLRTASSGTDPLELRVAAFSGDPAAEVSLSGVRLEGWIHVTRPLRRLRLLHSTLVPGRRLNATDGASATTDESLLVDAVATGLRLEAAFTILGRVVLPERSAGATILDCIVDGLGEYAFRGEGATPDFSAGPALAVERATLLGTVRAQSLEASESIFTEPPNIDRLQSGCIRFSYVAPAAVPRTPRRYRCQPDLAGDEAVEAARRRHADLSEVAAAAIRSNVAGRLEPVFTASRYGQPGYAQLHLACPREIVAGAADWSEMGAFNHRKHAQRESNLLVRLRENLPFGLEAGLVYVT